MWDIYLGFAGRASLTWTPEDCCPLHSAPPAWGSWGCSEGPYFHCPTASAVLSCHIAIVYGAQKVAWPDLQADYAAERDLIFWRKDDRRSLLGTQQLQRPKAELSCCKFEFYPVDQCRGPGDMLHARRCAGGWRNSGSTCADAIGLAQ